VQRLSDRDPNPIFEFRGLKMRIAERVGQIP
jgi:hypothetical protein